MTDERVVPYHCPYCGEEDLCPSEAHGTWECNTCMRAFSVKFVGLIVRPVTYPSPEAGPMSSGAARPDLTAEVRP